MSLPASDTIVTYPDGDLTSAGIVTLVEPLPDGRTAVVLDRTAFHPVDPVWPDQPQGDQPDRLVKAETDRLGQALDLGAVRRFALEQRGVGPGK